MLDPTAPATPWLIAAVLVALAALLVARARRRSTREFAKLRRAGSTLKRQAIMRRWLAESFATFIGSSVVVLSLAWQFIGPLLDVTARAWPIAGIRALFATGRDGEPNIVAWVVLVFGSLVLVAASVALVFVARAATDRERAIVIEGESRVDRQKRTQIVTVGDIRVLMPRNRQELRLAAALSINAGVAEELLFRLAIPAAVFGVVVGFAGEGATELAAAIAVGTSILLFGALHAYQGLVGVIATTIVGAVLMGLYLATGSIIAVMVVHALIDLRSLVLIPIAIDRVHEKPGVRAKPRSPRATVAS